METGHSATNNDHKCEFICRDVILLVDACTLKDNEHYLEILIYVGVVLISLQLLGPLPQFSQKNSASFNPLQFDDQLDSLLNNDIQSDYHDTTGNLIVSLNISCLCS